MHAEPLMPESAAAGTASAEADPSQGNEPEAQGKKSEGNGLESRKPESREAEADGPEAAKRAARSEERAIREYVRRVLDELMAELQAGGRGVEIREIAGGYRMATKPEYHDAIRSFVKSLKPAMKLSLQALETLAVVAYKQPVTAPEITEIRGVESGGVLGSLLSRKLITTAGRKPVIGRPILYKTTKEFLLRFGLKDLNELPSIEEFEKMAGELADAELEPAGEARAEGGLTTSEAEQAMNDEPDGDGEPGAVVEEPAAEEPGAQSDVDVTTGRAAEDPVAASGNAAGVAEEPEIVIPEEPIPEKPVHEKAAQEGTVADSDRVTMDAEKAGER
jgi:segregation and condensation protein B